MVYIYIYVCVGNIPIAGRTFGLVKFSKLSRSLMASCNFILTLAAGGFGTEPNKEDEGFKMDSCIFLGLETFRWELISSEIRQKSLDEIDGCGDFCFVERVQCAVNFPLVWLL